MAIRIKVEKKVNSKGEKGYVIKDFELLKRTKLPALYFDLFPHCYADCYDEEIIIEPSHKGNYVTFAKGEFITEKELDSLLDYLHACGENLRKVNQKLRKLEEEWNGTVEFII